MEGVRDFFHFIGVFCLIIALGLFIILKVPSHATPEETTNEQQQTSDLRSQRIYGGETTMIHQLKILPEYYQAVVSGNKTFEIRKNDRNFKVGDLLMLEEWNNGKYTGKTCYVKVSYICDYEQKENIVVLGIKKINSEVAE